MAINGLIAVQKLRLHTSRAATNFIELQSPAGLSASLPIKFFSTLPGAGVTNMVTIDSNGSFGHQTIPSGGGGNIALTMPSSTFNVSGSPGTNITVNHATQLQKTFFAGSNTTDNQVPTWRTILASDIPKTFDSSWITNFDTQVRTSRLDQMAVPTASINFNNQKAIGLAEPTNLQDAATKNYVDAAVTTGVNQGVVRVASTGNVSLSTPGSTFDGVTLTNVGTDLILLKNQATPADNGIYVWNGAGSPLTRATNADTSAEVRTGLFIFVSEGTIGASQGYRLTTTNVILGTTPLTFTQVSGAGQINAGAGMTKTGNQLDIAGTTDRITVLPDSIDIASTYAGQTSITTLGTIATGVWNGTSIAVANGGTGATTAAAARSNLGTSGVYRIPGGFTVSSLVAGILSVNHGLGQRYVIPIIIDENAKQIIPDEVTFVDANNLTVDLTNYPGFSGTWNGVFIG
jgi:hypothetical protein